MCLYFSDDDDDDDYNICNKNKASAENLLITHLVGLGPLSHTPPPARRQELKNEGKRGPLIGYRSEMQVMSCGGDCDWL